MRRPRIIVALGTRPEAIKMAPVVHALRAAGGIDVRVVVTGQHRALLDDALASTGLRPDVDLDLMQPGQPLEVLAARILAGVGGLLRTEPADRLLVHGDTATTAASTLAAHYARTPVAHVEAGLRSGDLRSPWPEEGHRRLVSALCDLHFAPTQAAAAALLAEGAAADTVHLTGNTAIDALFATRDRLAADPSLAAGLDATLRLVADRRIVTVTLHRRETIGPALAGIAAAVARIADRTDTAVVLPLHPHPAVGQGLRSVLGGHPSVMLVPPLDHVAFVRLLQLSDLVLTDSGGVQEEAPSLGKPVLVLREVTERPEGIAAGNAHLVGTRPDAIVRHATALLDDEHARRAMARVRNPYGDGRAAERIAAILARLHR